MPTKLWVSIEKICFFSCFLTQKNMKRLYYFNKTGFVIKICYYFISNFSHNSSLCGTEQKESQLNIKCLQISRYIMLYIVEHFNLFISGIKYTKKCHDTDMQQIILIHNRSHANHWKVLTSPQTNMTNHEAKVYVF